MGPQIAMKKAAEALSANFESLKVDLSAAL